MGCQRVKCRQVVFAVVGPTKVLSYEQNDPITYRRTYIWEEGLYGKDVKHGGGLVGVYRNLPFLFPSLFWLQYFQSPQLVKV